MPVVLWEISQARSSLGLPGRFVQVLHLERVGEGWAAAALTMLQEGWQEEHPPPGREQEMLGVGEKQG